ncbi:endonuclease-reverse transcriptase [Plakobranchus ocellatus]|uniref:Endonuclease-reverse transcriptase n=1 Tax=Plakobranchus ocellatus TaxID=259542 RepID=A0AAV4BQ62_9GAST|nr:endonuclease-reverse transcriptase [Plakobranchus ocellatus]
MTYGCQIWTLTKQLCHKLQTAQRAMERKMLNIKLKDRIPTTEIRKKAQVIDVVQYIQKQTWRWAGHITREKDKRWAKRCTEWQPRALILLADLGRTVPRPAAIGEGLEPKTEMSQQIGGRMSHRRIFS